MIQRIQSVFLLLATGSAFGLFGLPFAKTDVAVAGSSLFSDQIYNILDDTVVLALFCAAGILAFLAIFLFKNRNLQSRLALLSILVMLGGIGWAIYQFSLDAAAKGAEVIHYSAGITLPFLGIIFAALAARFIKKDDKLVKSMDRLR
ncbi:MAG: DUF4293 domain-containing protein [Saprospiraceae bacterium]|nr:DUF4293 domain-containing protein [Saprospiraceae bacterium]MCB9326065.1 DUF4293 domain-containing protein [Lewinellaceae bacterium]